MMRQWVDEYLSIKGVVVLIVLWAWWGLGILMDAKMPYPSDMWLFKYRMWWQLGVCVVMTLLIGGVALRKRIYSMRAH